MTRTDEHLDVVELACVALDDVEEYGIWAGDAAGLLVLHGLAMYARDTARSAAILVRAGRTLNAAALTRIVNEHAVLAQWLKDDPDERARLFIQQGMVERARWFDVVEAASLGFTRPQGLDSKKNVNKTFDTVKNLFGDSENGKQLYLNYRNFSQFIHPSATTFARYAQKTPVGGLLLRGAVQEGVDQDPEGMSFYLATATNMCALPYLDLLDSDKHVHAAAALRLASAAAHIPTSLG
jgi:hypothetical protein